MLYDNYISIKLEEKKEKINLSHKVCVVHKEEKLPIWLLIIKLERFDTENAINYRKTLTVHVYVYGFA